MATLLRGRTSPFLSIGDLSFDAEISGRRGGRREYTNERIAAGIEVSDHSFRRAREFTLTGAVSAIAQFQNIGRPGSASARGVGQRRGLGGVRASSASGAARFAWAKWRAIIDA